MEKIRENRIFALIFRSAALVIGLFGLIVMLKNAPARMMLTYYTIQTNIMTLLLFAALVVKSVLQLAADGKKGRVACLPPALQLCITFYITITMVVYWALLSWQTFSMTGAGNPVLMKIGNVIVHGFVALFAIADWIMFMPHGEVKYKSALYWLAYPAAYAVFIFLIAEFSGINYAGSRYPYPFIDTDVLGGYVALVVIALAAAFYGLGLLYIKADKALAGGKKEEEE